MANVQRLKDGRSRSQFIRDLDEKHNGELSAKEIVARAVRAGLDVNVNLVNVVRFHARHEGEPVKVKATKTTKTEPKVEAKAPKVEKTKTVKEVSKSEFVRSCFERSGVDLPAAEVLKRAAKKNIDLTSNLIAQVRFQMKKAS